MSAAFHPDFWSPASALHRSARQSTMLRFRGRHAVLASRAGLLTAIDIIIALPSLPTATTLLRPRAFGNGLRKLRAQELLVSRIGLRVGDGFPGTESAASRVSERGRRMKGPAISSVETLTLEEALSYMDIAMGDELAAAFELARDRNLLDGGTTEPDETEVHHALFMLRRARGLAAPSFDSMRVQLRRLLPAA